MDTMNMEEIKKLDATKLDEKKLEQIAKTAAMMLDGITTYANTRGVSNEELEALYSVGLRFYRSGRLEDAEKVFRFLCIISHVSPKYWTALGAVRQAGRLYKEAIQAYAAAALYDLHLPKPHYYSAQCALALGDLDAAESGCRSLLHYCPAGTAVNDEFRAKATELLARVTEARQAETK